MDQYEKGSFLPFTRKLPNCTFFGISLAFFKFTRYHHISWCSFCSWDIKESNDTRKCPEQICFHCQFNKISKKYVLFPIRFNVNFKLSCFKNLHGYLYFFLFFPLSSQFILYAAKAILQTSMVNPLLIYDGGENKIFFWDKVDQYYTLFFLWIQITWLTQKCIFAHCLLQLKHCCRNWTRKERRCGRKWTPK